jgi:hypothetical protein
MKLKTFSPENTGDNTIPTMSINSNAVFRLNKAAIDLLKLSENDKVLFHQDEDEPEDWYISKDKENGFLFNVEKARPNRYVRITNLYKSFKECFESSVFKFYISTEPIKSDKSNIIFPIITKNNLRKKQ